MPKKSKKNGKKPALHYLYRKTASGDLKYVGVVRSKVKTEKVYSKRKPKRRGRGLAKNNLNRHFAYSR